MINFMILIIVRTFIPAAKCTASSPDSNPMDHAVWGYLTHKVSTKNYAILGAPKETLLEEWDNLDIQYLRATTDSYPKWRREGIKVKGGRFKNYKQRRERAIEKLLERESDEKIFLEPFLQKVLWLDGRIEAQWLRRDMNACMWEDTEEYGIYTKKEKLKLGKICGIEMDQIQGDIQTTPNDKIVFDAPYDEKQVYYAAMSNTSARRIAFAVKITNMKRLGVDPPCGVLDPKEDVILAVSRDAFTYGQEDTKNDRITIEWTNTPDDATKEFRPEWFQGDGMVRRKSISLEYKKEILSPEDDVTQSGKSNSSSPVPGLSSRMRHVEMRKSEAEKERTIKDKNKEKITSITLKSLLRHLVPFYRGVLTPEECGSVDGLFIQKMKRAEASQISPNHMKFVIHSLTWSVINTIERSFTTTESVNFTVHSLVNRTRQLIQRLDIADVVQIMGIFDLEAEVVNNKNVFDRELKWKQRDWAVRQPDFKAAQYLKEEIGWRVADKVFDLTKFNPLVLDIGCGVGHITPHLIKENVGKIIQVDVSGGMKMMKKMSEDSNKKKDN